MKRAEGNSTMPATTTITVQLKIESYFAKEAIRAVLHTILFNRILVTTRPVDCDYAPLDVTYPRLDDAKIDEVSPRLKGFIQGQAGKRKGQVHRACAQHANQGAILPKSKQKVVLAKQR